ncbi:phosphoenolpyruvate--protein phosphotransferase [Nitratireductor sp. ZSWI3]|uniref:phosphoenolpyruvate--protein phosphotransferase n=1 Tax=Nitratireductor sp. ZSWI3 TaxID=2966359 RepID=UPI00215066F5|nr:phosphoenolpyruvate--protein phosphotransferase [Nitratireductor sp. ZSWI3]MCR4267998.1 phosphoenolpyruvate--protein phosphotransferase [Nitratireductor sp. ZSWI3]
MERSTIVRVQEGLHARPATRFVRLAKGFESDVEIVKGGKAVSAKSSVKLMLLGVKENDEVTIRANGADAIEAVEALIAYLENPRSGVEEGAAGQEAPADASSAPPQPPAAAPVAADVHGGLRGVAASAGFGLGPVFAHFPPQIVPRNETLTGDQIGAEKERFEQAVRRLQEKLDRSLGAGDMQASDRGIVTALRDIASDEALREGTLEAIDGGFDAVSAVIAASSRLAADFRNLDDAYMSARAEDLEAIARQICLTLLGQEEAKLDDIAEGAILVAEDIGAWDLARAPLKRLGGVVCGHGGATSHVAIIARTHGIPAVLGLGDGVHALRDAAEAAVDGSTGFVFADPDAGTRTRFAAMIRAADSEKEALKAYKDVVPRRADGTVIHVAANLGSLEEIEAAQEAGAMGVGLFRTELLFMRHMHLPSEDMQAETYAALARAFPEHPVIVRTLDIGGDKPIAGVEFPEEENPFLGWRGIRMCLDRPDIFKVQLRALLRAAVHGNLRVMLPMVSAVEEVRRTRALIDECAAELAAEGVAHADFPLGVMIETPAAVFGAAALAKEVAFFSVGTNDLTQYVMAADRLNPAVAALNDAAHPAVMAAIEQAAQAAVAAGIEIGMCGEAAARADLIPEFIRMGLTELSMSPASIQAVKKQLQALFEGEKAPPSR